MRTPHRPLHKHRYILVHIHRHPHTHTPVHTCTYTYVCTNTYTRVHTRIIAHAYIHTYICIFVCREWGNREIERERERDRDQGLFSILQPYSATQRNPNLKPNPAITATGTVQSNRRLFGSRSRQEYTLFFWRGAGRGAVFCKGLGLRV